ncbi:MAG: glutathione S-transferase [Labilithrix sp.]|nr:glutathione S-transferase [Labilithrix sp.]
MITVHHLERSRSQRVLWLLEELGLEYELKKYERDPRTMLAPPELRKVHPLGKSPIVTDGERTLAESGAILDYLVTAHGGGRLRPEAGTPERLRYDYWLHYAEGSAMPPLLLSLVFQQVKARAPWPVKPIAKGIANKVLADFVRPQMELHFDWVERELGKSTWFAGEELSAADIQMSYPVEAHAARVKGASRPNMAAWLERVRARPAYRRALERGGPVTFEAPDARADAPGARGR